MANARFDSVVKRFGDVTALSSFTLDVADGEFLVFVGPSGSGKTTALRLLAGLESMTDGEILIDGKSVNNQSPRDRDIAMVFQDYALYPQMSVFKNLAFGLRIRKFPKEDIQRRVTRTAEMLGIEKLLARRPRELSGGQQQRVALGRALIREPKVFLMDEPLSNLDAQLRVQTRGEIKRLQRAVGVTTIYVTHDQVEAMTMGDRIVVMNEGRIAQVGRPQEVYNDPADAFVARFIGNPPMTVAGFSATTADGGVRLSRGSTSFDVPRHDALTGDVLVGVRPEHAELWRDEAGLLGPLEGTVQFSEDLGRERFVGVKLDDEATFTLVVGADASIELNHSLRFGLRPGHVHLFDDETGRSLARL